MGQPWEALEAALGSAFPPQLALHSVLVLECPGRSGVLAFDFLPTEPTLPLTAATLLSGNAVPAITRVRELGRLPSRHCQLVGVPCVDDPTAVASAFSAAYPMELMLLRRDCHTFVRELTAELGVRDDLT